MFKHSDNGPGRENAFAKDVFCLKQYMGPV